MFKSALLTFVLLAVTVASAADRKILLIAGSPSHGKLEHEHRAGLLLFQKCLASVPGVVTDLHSNGWVRTPKAPSTAPTPSCSTAAAATGTRSSRETDWRRSAG